MLIRRLALTVTALTSALTVSPGALADARHGQVDHLTVTVAESGGATADGTYELYCHPTAGDHRDAEEACDRLDEMTVWGKDPFAPVTPGMHCTLQYGGAASAHVRGVWAGKRVDAHFNRENGCEMKRWDALVPLLPHTGMRPPS
ncbi:SSI family serine proteinase inhibitor [Streptomyces sp. WMMB 322]|uniref:SSI family serine proteinase inhibitor n=1 Tax=Streptomyces sp. WMMB 322 TaxID=1286821 RepID=UPI0006E3D430|nr:SSI family serine proteinase inhibitor [Streptomyces sp. WMMB 322]SCK08076.1 Subtilisin inhibitor-like [Streptomyces sp. WMMB 322]